MPPLTSPKQLVVHQDVGDREGDTSLAGGRHPAGVISSAKALDDCRLLPAGARDRCQTGAVSASSSPKQSVPSATVEEDYR